MPIVSVTFVRGPEPAAQAALAEDITSAVVERLGAPRETVSVLLHPVGADQWAVAGRLLTETLGPRN